MFASRKFVWGKLALLLCLILNACTGRSAGPASTRTLQTSAIPIPKITTPSNLPAISLPQPSLTVTPSPQLSPIYTSTPLHPTNTNPPDPQAILTEQALELRSAQIANFSPTCGEFNLYDAASISPSGNWLAISCNYSQNHTLEVDSKEGKRWMLNIKDFLSEKAKFEGLVGVLFPVQWTTDEKYLYFTSNIDFEGGGACFYGFGGVGLFRINLDDGTVTTTLPESPSGDGYEITFSPGGKMLAYAYDANKPVIVDMKTGKAFNIDAGNGLVGKLTWSSDGSELAYSSCQQTQDGSGIVKSALKIYSLKTHISKTVLEVPNAFVSIESQIGNQLLISNNNYQTGQTDILVFDWSSGQLATATPEPD
jgi:Tol biopolymer transport system component